MEKSVDWESTDEYLDAALDRAAALTGEPLIVSAAFHRELECLILKLTDGRRLLIPREELAELKDATVEQASNITIVPTGSGVWWPQLDDGLYLPEFLDSRWTKNHAAAA